MKRPNLALEIGVLEAQKGMEPSIAKCKDIARVKGRKNKLNCSSDNLDTQLEKLRTEHLSRKIFAAKKLVQRALKKAKSFALQKTIRRSKGEEREEKKEKYANLIKQLRDLKHVEMAKIMFNRNIIDGTDYLKTKIPAAFREKTETVNEESDDLMKVLEGGALKRSLQDISKELEDFCRELYHEQVFVNGKKEDKVIKIKEEAKRKERKSKDSAGNQNTRGKNISRKSLGNREEESQFHMLHTEDEDDDQNTKRNRPGQRARRARWEAENNQISIKSKKEVGMKRKNIATDASHEQERVVIDRRSSGAVDKGLHPSWEAKRKQKEMLAKAATLPPTNTKIKFSEDD